MIQKHENCKSFLRLNFMFYTHSKERVHLELISISVFDVYVKGKMENVENQCTKGIHIDKP